MSKPPLPNPSFDVHALLEQRRQVAVIWGIEDVQSVRPDLTDDESWEVLRYCRKFHDCKRGFTWDLIEWVSNSLFPSFDEEGAGQ